MCFLELLLFLMGFLEVLSGGCFLEVLLLENALVFIAELDWHTSTAARILHFL